MAHATFREKTTKNECTNATEKWRKENGKQIN